MERCPRCGKTKETSDQGRITQWVSGCLCATESVASDEGEQLLFCTKCNLRIVEKKAGRLTQWIFSSHQCQCEQPEPTTRAPAVQPKPYRPPRTEEFLNEKELDVDANAFPLDRYKPLSEIGFGGGGLVYLCRDRFLKKKVAIKCLKTPTTDHLVSLQREAKAISHLQHANIVTVLDFGTVNGVAPYMVMDYVKGFTIEEILKQTGPLSIDAAKSVCRQTASGLSHAHNKGIFHRDIKSANILIVDKSQQDSGKQNLDVRIIDFGLATAKHLYQESTIMHGRTIVGTPAYMPPDQALGYSYDERSEIYALGCVLFESLTGKPPYVGDTALATISMHAHHPTPALSERNSDIEYPRALESIVAKCLAKDRDERFQSMDELIDALDSMASRPVLTQEILFNPELRTTGGFLLSGSNEMQTESDPSSTEGGNPLSDKRGYYSLLVLAALMLVGFVVFAVASTLNVSKIRGPNIEAPGSPFPSTLEDFEPGTRGDRTVRGIPEVFSADENEKRKALSQNDNDGMLLSRDDTSAPRVKMGTDGSCALENGNDQCLVKLCKEIHPKKLALEGGKFSYVGLKGLTKIPIDDLTFSNCRFAEVKNDLKFLNGMTKLRNLQIDQCDESLEWFLDHAGKISALRSIQFSGLSASDVKFAGLENLPNLETVSFIMLPNFSGVGLKYLHGKPITMVNLSYLSSLSDAPLAHLRDLNKLSVLGVYHCPDIQGEALNELKDLPLEDVRLVGLPISKRGFSNIAKIQRLKHLTTELIPLIDSHSSSEHVDISYLRATYYKYEPDSFNELKNLPALESVVLNANLFYVNAFDDLAALPKLKELDLMAADGIIASSELSKLIKSKNLDSLLFFGPGISSQGWQSIATLDKLRNLGALRSGMNDGDLNALARLKLNKLAINSLNITGAGIGQLARMKTLKSFELDCPKVAARDIRALWADLPGSNIRRGCTYRNFAPVGFWNIRGD